MATNRKTYSAEFKKEAVRLLETSGKSGREIEDDLGIGGGRFIGDASRLRRQTGAYGRFRAREIRGTKSWCG